jgi:3-oxoacyl-[acyl-carrier protein] reductase
MTSVIQYGSTATTAGMPNYPDLHGKVAVVTGGSRGIGATTCRLLAATGAKVAVNGRDAAAIDTVVNDIRASGGQAIGLAADCTDATALDQMRQQIEQKLGAVDIVIACAGGHGEPTPTAQITEEQWRFVIDANLTATFLTVKTFLPGMIERHRGSIVTMASTAGRMPGGASAVYAAAKAGVVMFSRHVANEVGKYGVRVNCIAPSSILTERTRRQIPEAQQQQMKAMFPLGRLGTPEDVALATLFLASDSSSWLTGLTLDVSGGRIMI